VKAPLGRTMMSAVRVWRMGGRYGIARIAGRQFHGSNAIARGVPRTLSRRMRDDLIGITFFYCRC